MFLVVFWQGGLATVQCSTPLARLGVLSLLVWPSPWEGLAGFFTPATVHSHRPSSLREPLVPLAKRFQIV